MAMAMAIAVPMMMAFRTRHYLLPSPAILRAGGSDLARGHKWCRHPSDGRRGPQTRVRAKGRGKAENAALPLPTGTHRRIHRRSARARARSAETRVLFSAVRPETAAEA